MAENKKKQFWFVLDSMTKIQSQPLTDEQLQISVMRMKDKDLDRFFIWTESWDKWVPLRSFIHNNEKIFLNVVDIISQVEKQNEETITQSMTSVGTLKEGKDALNNNSQELNKDLNMDEFSVQPIELSNDLNFKKLNKKSEYKNRSTRHELKIEILLISKMGKTFRSYSQNISLTGSLLEDNIPFDYYGENFDVVVVNRHARDNTNSRVQVKGITVGDGVSRRIQFQAMSDQTKNKLLLLLNEYLEIQKNITRKSS